MLVRDEWVGGLLVSHRVHGPSGLRGIRWSSTRYGPVLAVHVHLRGGCRGHVGDTPLRTDPERLAVIDLTMPFGAVTTAADALWVLVPRRLLGGLGGTGPVRHFPTRSGSGQALRAAVIAVWGHTPGSSSDGPDSTRGLVDVLTSALGTGGAETRGAVLGAAMRQHVLANIDDLELDSTRLCEVFNCSRATLYRLFRDEGGVARYISERRLDRALDDLLDAEAADLTICETASRWGFDNPSHFHRRFTARFGVPPSAVRVRGAAKRTTRTAVNASASPSLIGTAASA